jgi:hypothetical protein
VEGRGTGGKVGGAGKESEGKNLLKITSIFY